MEAAKREDLKLTARIKDIFRESKRAHGGPGVHAEPRKGKQSLPQAPHYTQYHQNSKPLRI